MFAKFATAKNRKNIEPLTFSSSGAFSMKKTMEKGVMVKRVHSDCNANLLPPDYSACYKTDALSLSYRAS